MSRGIVPGIGITRSRIIEVPVDSTPAGLYNQLLEVELADPGKENLGFPADFYNKVLNELDVICDYLKEIYPLSRVLLPEQMEKAAKIAKQIVAIYEKKGSNFNNQANYDRVKELITDRLQLNDSIKEELTTRIRHKAYEINNNCQGYNDFYIFQSIRGQWGGTIYLNQVIQADLCAQLLAVELADLSKENLGFPEYLYKLVRNKFKEICVFLKGFYPSRRILSAEQMDQNIKIAKQIVAIYEKSESNFNNQAHYDRVKELITGHLQLDDSLKEELVKKIRQKANEINQALDKVVDEDSLGYDDFHINL